MKLPDLEIMQALQDATAILDQASVEVSRGTMAVFQINRHAQAHLNKQMQALLAEEASHA